MTTKVPPGWKPHMPGYTFKDYQDKLKIWYSMCDVTDAKVGPTIATRLKDGAWQVANRLRLIQPGNTGQYDLGDALSSDKRCNK